MNKLKIYPACKLRKETDFAINFEGYVVPCCHFGGPRLQQLKDILGDKFEQLHVSKGTLADINRSEAMYLIEQTFYNGNPIQTCVDKCSKPINPKDFTDNNVPIKTKKI